ncbi:MAG: hypothetical protein CMP23_02195 [Rickettsiales bacterium]|nr:hypothetical protein [Rickettsiales bacterium]
MEATVCERGCPRVARRWAGDGPAADQGLEGDEPAADQGLEGDVPLRRSGPAGGAVVTDPASE